MTHTTDTALTQDAAPSRPRRRSLRPLLVSAVMVAVPLVSSGMFPGTAAASAFNRPTVGGPTATPSPTPSPTATPQPTTYPSFTNVHCSPNPTAYTSTATCTVSVGGSGPSVPTGSVNWSASGSGTFLSSTCALSGGTCSVTYKPSGLDIGTSVTIVGSYGGDATYVSSAAKTLETITQF